MGHARKEMLSFFLTTGCNLDCSYCYTHNDMHAGQVINLDFALAGIDWYLRSDMAPHFRFFGPGEPTTQMATVATLVREARLRSRPRVATFEIQTNGVFSNRAARFLAAEFDIIWVSCDGLPWHHDRYRRNAAGHPSSPMLEKNIRFLIDQGRGMTGVRSTISSDNVHDQQGMLRYYADLGVRHVWADPLFPAIGEPSSSVDLVPIVFAEEFLRALPVAMDLGIQYGSILTCNFDEEVEYQCRACLPAPHLTTDGFVSACDMALFGKDVGAMDDFIFGYWDDAAKSIGLFPERIAKLRSRTGSNMPGCRGCPVVKHCAGHCLGEVANETGDMFGRKEATCEAIRHLFAHMDLDSVVYDFLHP